jgi:hypothetical protein
MGRTLWVLVLNEVRLRTRRLATLFALLAMVVFAWSVIPDPHGSSTLALLTIDGARVAYTSSALALGTAKMAAILLGLIGFYLVRGRIGEDLRSGIGGVIAATPVGNALFLFSRWLGGVAYLLSLVVCLLCSVLVCHLLRGSGPIQLGVYVQTYAVMLVPMVFFVVSCALLCDSTRFLMGKPGDVLFFIWWVSQFPRTEGFITAHGHASELPLSAAFDFAGLINSIMGLAIKLHLPIGHISRGFTHFDPSLAPVTLPAMLWSGQMLQLRVASALLAMLPLLLAMVLFHRFSPDRVKLAASKQGWAMRGLIDRLARPLARLPAPVLRLAARLPGWPGQVLADCALMFMAMPVAVALLLLSVAAAVLLPAQALPGVLTMAVAIWGVLISEVSSRDHAADSENLTGVVPGGIERRYLLHWLASMLSGLLFMGVIVLRFAFTQPMLALALSSGLASLAALATLLGRCTRTSRAFLVMFLLGWYIAISAKTEVMLDVVGFNGVADGRSVLLQVGIASAALLVGYAYNRSNRRFF